MSVLDQSVKIAIEALEGTDADFQALLEEERAGKNRKSMIGWLESQGAQSSRPPDGSDIAPEVEKAEPTDVSAPGLAPVYEAPKKAVAGIDSIEGGIMPISELISVLCQKRDRLQRSVSCGVENIKVNHSGIKISVR